MALPKFICCKRWPIGLTLLLGFSASILGAWLVWRLNHSSRESRFEAAAENRVTAIHQEINHVGAALRTLAIYCGPGLGQDESRFARFAGSLETRSAHPDYTFFWIPEVPLPDRNRFDREMRRSDGPGAMIWEVDRDGLAVESPPRLVAHPVRFAAGAEEAWRGFDLASEPAFQSSLDHARHARQFAATPVTGMGAMGGTAASYLMVYPVYDPDNPDVFTGFVAALVPLSALVETALAPLHPAGVSLWLSEEVAGGSQSTHSYFHFSRAARGARRAALGVPNAGQVYRRKFPAAGRRWVVSCEPDGELARTPVSPSLAVLCAGLLITLLGAMVWRMHFEKAGKVERQVEERTRQLKLANESLQREMETQLRMEQELAQAHRAAIEASHLKSQFLANVSHELRTPLNGIIGMTDFLLGSGLEDSQREYAEVVMQCARLLRDLINDVLDMSKVEAGKLKLEPSDFDLHDVIEQVVAPVAEQASRKGIEVVTLIAPWTPHLLRGDAARLRQILLNLANNAVKFTEEGEVTLRALQVERDANDVLIRFEVTDTGIGIPLEQQPLLFRRFVQADGASTRRYGGTGLGLAICKELSELMGGEIGVRSTPGKGSQFWFTAKLKAGEAQVAYNNWPELSGTRLLVVEDHDGTRQAIGIYAESAGVLCGEADSWNAGLEMAVAARHLGNPFDLVMVDERIAAGNPDKMRESLAERLGGVAPGLIVLMPIGRGQPAAAPDGVAFLTKPVQRSRLLRALQAAMLRTADATAPPALPRPSEAQPGEAPAPRQGQPRILVAEDNPVNQRVALLLLARLGYDAKAVANGLEAVLEVEKEHYDAILMDCQMPELDGYEATARIREMDGPRARIPVIALTANAMAGDRERCIAAEMDDYLAKPVQADLMAQVLERWVGAPCPQQN